METKTTASAERGKKETTELPRAQLGAAPPFAVELLTLVFFFGALIAVGHLAPPPPAPKPVLECPVPVAPTQLLISVDVRPTKVIASCIEVATRGAYTAEGRQ